MAENAFVDLRKLEYLAEIKSLAVVIILGFVIVMKKFCEKCHRLPTI